MRPGASGKGHRLNARGDAQRMISMRVHHCREGRRRRRACASHSPGRRPDPACQSLGAPDRQTGEESRDGIERRRHAWPIQVQLRHAAVSQDDSKRRLDWAFRFDFERNGPSLFRICRTTLVGWRRHGSARRLPKESLAPHFRSNRAWLCNSWRPAHPRRGRPCWATGPYRTQERSRVSLCRRPG